MEEVKKIYIRAQAGNRDAFREIVEMHYQFAYRVAYRLLLDEEESKDVIQDVFLKVWKKINQYDIKQKFTTWLYRIVVNQCYDVLRRKKRYTYVELDDTIHQDDSCVEDELHKRHLIQSLRDKIEKLPLKQRLVFTLRDFEDLSIQEIASHLNISRNAVKSNLYLARKWAREILGEVYP